VQLFGEMTALQNVQSACTTRSRATCSTWPVHTRATRRESAAAVARAMGLLKFVGLADLAYEEARNLPYGKQRLLEIARALALDPQLLLLDEPAAGLTAPDIKELVTFIRKIRDHGITVILIEHHMDVVMSICDTVSVLDFGRRSPRACRPRCRRTKSHRGLLVDKPSTAWRHRTRTPTMLTIDKLHAGSARFMGSCTAISIESRRARWSR
jgi:ABC-type sugar transport system ATPase subunit